MAKQDTATRDAKLLTNAFMWGAIAVSFSHIVYVFHVMLGLDIYQSALAPFLVDGLFLYGKRLMCPRFHADTRKQGRRIVLTSGVMSLAANVAAGAHSIGGMVFGVMVVGAFLLTEFLAPKIRLAPAAKAAQTRKANAAKPAPKPAARKAPAKPRIRKPQVILTPVMSMTGDGYL